MDLTNLAGLRKVCSGKVREVYDAGKHLVFVATDRISAYDCILPDLIPGKGAVLTSLSSFWFARLDFVPNHVISLNVTQFPEEFARYEEVLRGRSMLVEKCTPLPVECVVRGYLAGSAVSEYQEKGTVGGLTVPSGLETSSPLPETLFTPSTKATTGHDENISWKECRRILGDDIAFQVREWSIELYEHAKAYAATCGVILADTKFEFGIKDGELILIDECLTPDSSRFWPAEDYAIGSNPPSFDKQFVRDYLADLDWDRTPPAPALPADIIEKTAARYQQALRQLTCR